VLSVGGDEAGRGTVLAESESDSDADGDDDNDGKELMERARRRHHESKLHGTVRVIWTDGDVSRHRVGNEGHVDVWCIDTAPGGQYYKDHLAVLDAELMYGGRSLAAEDDDEDDDDDDEEMSAAGAVSSLRTPLGNCAH